MLSPSQAKEKYQNCFEVYFIEKQSFFLEKVDKGIVRKRYPITLVSNKPSFLLVFIYIRCDATSIPIPNQLRL